MLCARRAGPFTNARFGPEVAHAYLEKRFVFVCIVLPFTSKPSQMVNSRRNNYDRPGSVRRAFTGTGRVLGGRGRQLGARFRDMAAAIGLAAVPAAVAGARHGLKRSFGGAAKTTHSNGLMTGRIVAEGTGGQYSSFSRKNKAFWAKQIDASCAPIVSTFSAALQVKSGVGLQNGVTALRLFDNTDVLQLYVDVGNTYKRFLLEKCMASVSISNIYLSNCTVDIYDVIARKDTGAAGVSDALTAWAQGDTDEGTSGLYAKCGATPFSVEDFNMYWKVVQKTRVVLGAGQMHKHRVNLDVNKIMNDSYIAYTAKNFRDLTYNTLIVIRGAPANDASTQTSVSVGAAGLNIVAEKEYHCKVLSTTVANVIDHTTLAISFAGGEQVVNVGGSTVTANAEG